MTTATTQKCPACSTPCDGAGPSTFALVCTGCGEILMLGDALAPGPWRPCAPRLMTPADRAEIETRFAALAPALFALQTDMLHRLLREARQQLAAPRGSQDRAAALRQLDAALGAEDLAEARRAFGALGELLEREGPAQGAPNCHGGPGTPTEACGACVPCLRRVSGQLLADLDKAMAELDRAEADDFAEQLQTTLWMAPLAAHLTGCATCQKAAGSLCATAIALADAAAQQAGQDAARCFRDDVLRLQREAIEAVTVGDGTRAAARTASGAESPTENEQ